MSFPAEIFSFILKSNIRRIMIMPNVDYIILVLIALSGVFMVLQINRYLSGQTSIQRNL